MFKAEVYIAEDLMDAKRTIVDGRGHGMAKTAYKARKEAARMANAQLCRASKGYGGCCIVCETKITNIRTGETTITY